MFGSTKKLLLAALASMALLGSLGSSAQAQDWRYRRPSISRKHELVDQLAARLEREARFLNRETDSHWRGTPDYRLFEREVDEIVRIADHIHDLAHRGGNLWHLRGDVERLNRLYQSTDRMFHRMVAFRRLDRETAFHLHRALNTVERTIGELRGALYF